MPDAQPARRKTDAVQNAMRALAALTQEERVRVLKAAAALWGVQP